MTGAWRVADVRAAERALMATVPEGTLMDRAAAGLARRIADTLAGTGAVYGRTVLLLVGAGNNGGDALYAGALLARRGVAVRAALLDPEHAHAGGLAALRAAGGRVVTGAPPPADVAVDGIVGIGGRGPLRPDAVALLGSVVADVMIAVDVPSGVEPDTGAVADPDAAVRADITVTFGCLKPGLVVGVGAVHAGQVELVDIGLGPYLAAPPALRVATREDVASWWPLPGPDSDKYSRGVVGLATGSSHYTGAAVLSVAGASAGPTGLVRYAGGAADHVRAAHPSVVVTDRIADAGRVQAWVCGSGLGTDDAGHSALRAVLAAPVPAVLDADALTMLADIRTPDVSDLIRARHAPIVVTPHDGEYARLAGHRPGADRVEAALALAVKLRATVLLKGDRTVVGGPDGTAWVNPTGSPALATAGTGDVLAGLLGSLLAAGLTPARAAVAAAYAHGLAGRAAAEHAPVTSSLVAQYLPETVRNLLNPVAWA